MLHFWDRVYINVGQDFSEGSRMLDFEKLIDDVAKQKRIHNGVALIENVEVNGTHTIRVFRGRTKKFIVQKTNEFISGLQEVQSKEENMASFTSKRQINRLVDAFHGKSKRISAYAVVIIYVMSVIILESSCGSDYNFSMMQDIIECVEKWVKDYSAEYPDDELAVFLLDCVESVSKAIQKRKSDLQAKDFPYIPKKNPEDPLDY